jgi:hypothetical protein
MKTRNKLNLPINFCTTGNFLNLKKVKFIPMDNPPKIKNSKHQILKLHNKSSTSNLSEIHTISKDEISKKDELIFKLQQKIKFLEKKIKLLEKSASKSKNRSRNTSFTNGLLLNTEKNSSNNINNYNYNHNYTTANSITNKNKHKTIIPLDKQLLKTKLTKNKKNIFELIDISKLKFTKKNQNSIKNRNNSFNLPNTNNNNNSLSNYTTYNYTSNNSCTGSELKPRKKSIKLKVQCDKINSLHNLLYSMSSSKNLKNKISGEKNRVTRKINGINTIPKKIRINQNASLKIMLSSTNYTNYSNNVSNSFKEETNVNTNTNNNGMTNISFSDIQNKLENIKNRTKNLFEVFSKMNTNLAQNQNLNNEIKRKKFPFNIKISKLEKVKK